VGAIVVGKRVIIGGNLSKLIGRYNFAYAFEHLDDKYFLTEDPYNTLHIDPFFCSSWIRSSADLLKLLDWVHPIEVFVVLNGS
jgi:hypothetical protein